MLEEGMGDVVILHTLEKTEEANAVVVLLEMHAVDDGSDRPHDFASAVGRHERLDLTVFEERILARGQRVCDIPPEHSNPVRIVCIKLVREIDQRACASSRKLADGDGACHRLGMMWDAAREAKTTSRK